MSAKQVRVSPNGDDGWRVYQPGNDRDSAHTETKAEAEKIGRQIAQNQGLELIVQKKDGTIDYRDSFGNDPFPPRG